MDYHAYRLIDHHYPIVLKSNVKGHFLRDNLRLFRVRIRINDDLIIWFYLIIRPDLFIVNQHHARINGLLKLISGGTFKAVYQEFVNTKGFLALVHSNAKPFIELIIIVIWLLLRARLFFH